MEIQSDLIASERDLLHDVLSDGDGGESGVSLHDCGSSHKWGGCQEAVGSTCGGMRMGRMKWQMVPVYD